MDLSGLSDEERLILGLRFRLKHIREALRQVREGRTPEGFGFTSAHTNDAMLDELRALEIEVEAMLRQSGGDGPAALN